MRRILVIVALLIVFFTLSRAEEAYAASFYVSPIGKDSICSQQSPCALNAGLEIAGAGDEVVLMDGVYPGLLTSKGGNSGNPITIRAENRHKAIINWKSGTLWSVEIRHSNIVLRGIKVDGTEKATINIFIRPVDAVNVQGVIVEDNWIINASGHMLQITDAKDVIIRHNLWENNGVVGTAAIFLSNSARDGLYLNNVEIYNNVFRNYSYHAVHYSGAGNTNTHHNIFDPRRIDSSRIEADGQMPGGESVITAYMYYRLINNSAGNLFKDNIIRNTNPPGSNYVIALDDNRVDVLNNVFINNPQNILIRETTPESAIIRNNIACNGPTINGTDYPNHKINILNQPQSECDAEVERIMNEISSLPGYVAVETPGGDLPQDQVVPGTDNVASPCALDEVQTDFGCMPNDPIGFTEKFYGYGIGFVGGLALLMFIWGGFSILTSQGDPRKINNGKSYIYYAIAGLLLAIFGFVFFEYLAVDILRIPGFTK